MSIALHARIKELEATVQRQAQELAELKERIAAIENRPKPGRPPKNG